MTDNPYPKGPPKRHSVLPAILGVLFFLIGWYWYAQWDRCRDRGPEWKLYKTLWGVPVCLRAERAP